MPVEKRNIIFEHMPVFLENLEVEIRKKNSIIWDDAYIDVNTKGHITPKQGKYLHKSHEKNGLSMIPFCITVLLTK